MGIVQCKLIFEIYLETGCGRTKMEAKNEAARRVLEKIREAGKRNESLRLLTSEVVKKCHDM